MLLLATSDSLRRYHILDAPLVCGGTGRVGLMGLVEHEWLATLATVNEEVRAPTCIGCVAAAQLVFGAQAQVSSRQY